MLKLLERKILPQFLIDTNRINARGLLPNMTVLEGWHAKGVIDLRMPWDAQEEAEAGGNSERRRKAGLYAAYIPAIGSPHEMAVLKDIETLIFPDGVKGDGDRNDCLIVFTTWKYSLSSNAVLVTNDGGSKNQPRGILGSARDLKSKLNVIVMSDEQAVALARRKIVERDRMNEDRAKMFGLPLPEWHGKDG